MSSNSAVKVPSQQSVKAYVDSQFKLNDQDLDDRLVHYQSTDVDTQLTGSQV